MPMSCRSSTGDVARSFLSHDASDSKHIKNKVAHESKNTHTRCSVTYFRLYQQSETRTTEGVNWPEQPRIETESHLEELRFLFPPLEVGGPHGSATSWSGTANFPERGWQHEGCPPWTRADPSLLVPLLALLGGSLAEHPQAYLPVFVLSSVSCLCTTKRRQVYFGLILPQQVNSQHVGTC